MNEMLTRAGIEPPIPVAELTLEVIEAEIARLEAELVAQGEMLPPQPR